jgi:WD40 repeat protein
MLNGDSLIGEIYYDQMLIIPFPNDLNKFYLFHLATYFYPGLYYSIIDLSLDSGRGAIIQKNILITNLPELSCGISAIKNGNGRDWWLVYRPSCYQSGCTPTNEFYMVGITPAGISTPSVQNIGSINSTNWTAMAFSPDGTKLAFVNYAGLVELYDFDRCTGGLSNPLNIHTETLIAPFSTSMGALGVEFSSNKNVLYVSTGWQTSKLLQYDLTAANILSTEYILADFNYPEYVGGELRRAPNNKIFWTCAWNDGIDFNYPYQDSVYNIYNMNLSFINSPNLLGSACFFSPFSYNLGNKRTYYGLPNNPDYSILAQGGSICDTLGFPNQIKNLNIYEEPNLNIFYHPDWRTAFINASNLQGKSYSLHIVDVSGKEIFSEVGLLKSHYFTKDYQCEKLSDGIYIVLFETENERIVRRMLIE